MPVTGGFVRHATAFVEPALGAATGWNFWYTMAISVPAELSAAATLIQFWDSSTNPAVFITVFLVVIVALNFCGIRFYGESEVVFASMKIALIIGLIIAGIVVDLGGAPNHDRLGFRYWRTPGAFNAYLVDGNTGKFLAFWSSLSKICQIPATSILEVGKIWVTSVVLHICQLSLVNLQSSKFVKLSKLTIPSSQSAPHSATETSKLLLFQEQKQVTREESYQTPPRRRSSECFSSTC